MNNDLPIIPQYALNLDRLKPGDIILSRESVTFKEILKNVHQLKGVAVSSTVRAFSRGYSHAMLYLDKAIFHAVIPHVYSYNPQRLAIRRESDICVLRHAHPIGTEPHMPKRLDRRLGFAFLHLWDGVLEEVF